MPLLPALWLLVLMIGTALGGTAHAAVDARTGVPTYYLARLDARECPSPRCGGVFIRPANRSFMQCADGAARPECHVPQLRLPAGQLDATQQAALDAALAAGTLLVRGQRLPQEVSLQMPKAGGEQLLVGQAWYPEDGGAAAGVFYRVRPSALQCVTAPCPRYRANVLNSPYSTVYVDTVTPGSQTIPKRWRNRVVEQSPGLLVAGKLHTVRTSGGTRMLLSVNRSYAPLMWQPPGKASCYVGGCSGEVCSATPGVVTTCIYKPEYACYSNARCERQTTGLCGWTRPDDMERCLERLGRP